jgi:predicted ATPase
MLPEVRDLFPDLPRPPAVDPEAARFRMFDAVTSFLRATAEAQPLMLLIDDLHVADTPSLLFLEFLAGELAESRIVAVVAFRDTDLTREHPLTATVGELLRHRVTRRLSLIGLTASDVARFIELTTGVATPAGLAAAVHAQTEGNPLFVGEVIGLLAAEGRLEPSGDAWSLAVPRGVREVIARRLARLSGECNELLTLASVLGREFDLPALERLSGHAPGQALLVLEEAVGIRLISDVPGALGRLRFSHTLVRDTLYDDIPPARRTALHRLAGEALEAEYAVDPDPHLAELAHHFVQAAPGGEVDKAVGYAHRGGDRAVRFLAYEERPSGSTRWPCRPSGCGAQRTSTPTVSCCWPWVMRWPEPATSPRRNGASFRRPESPSGSRPPSRWRGPRLGTAGDSCGPVPGPTDGSSRCSGGPWRPSMSGTAHSAPA